MLSIADNEGIRVRWWNFKPPILGIYWAGINMPPYIGLDKSLMFETPLTRCIMAEELGHHFTTYGDTLARTYFHNQARLRISQTELVAQKWAARYLIPLEELYSAFRFGYTERWDLAEYFEVTEEMVTFRLKLPDLAVLKASRC